MLTSQRQPSLASRKRASALIGTLVMLGILALGVGVMLASANQSIRSSRNKIMYEEAYQAAVSGTHVARAWLIDPEMAVKQTGASTTFQTNLEKIMVDATAMGQDILDDYSNADASPSTVGSKWFGDLPQKTLADGRVVLFDGFPKAASGAVAAVGLSQAESNKSLFNSTGQELKNYVADLRITTLSPSESGDGALRKASFIIESRGVSEYSGEKKERIIQQRVLVYPKDRNNPLLGAKEALIVSGNYEFAGSSHALVRWAPALAKGDIKLLNLSLTADAAVPGNYILNASNKSIVGGGTVEDGQLKNEVDYWVKWMAGTAGTLKSASGTLFDALPNSETVVDLFKELSSPTGISGVTTDNFTLTGNYESSVITPESSKGLYDLDEDGQITNGSLVQGSQDVDDRIDSFFSTDLDPELLKEVAIENGTYIKWDSNKGKNGAFVNSEGQVLYADDTGGMSPYGSKQDMLTDISQISMGNLLPNGNPTVAVHDKESIPDKLLYVDAPGKSIDVSSLFWKGIMYADCDLMGSGSSGSVDVWAKDPAQYAADPFDNEGGTDQHKKLSNVIMDGIMIANGNINIGGNMVIYGTLATTENVTLNGTPSVFYNSANANGRMQKPTDDAKDSRLIGSRILEEDGWLLVSAAITE